MKMEIDIIPIILLLIELVSFLIVFYNTIKINKELEMILREENRELDIKQMEIDKLKEELKKGKK